MEYTGPFHDRGSKKFMQSRCKEQDLHGFMYSGNLERSRVPKRTSFQCAAILHTHRGEKKRERERGREVDR